MKYRIDLYRDGEWEPGRVTFHDSYPRDSIEEVAAEFHRVLNRPVRIVLVDEIVIERVEEIKRFDQPVEQAA